jgi:hypothetical protein
MTNGRAVSLRRVLLLGTALAVAAPACADEGGVSFWLPGQLASFAANREFGAENRSEAWNLYLTLALPLVAGQ